MAGLFSLPTPDAVRANATQQASQRAGLFSQAPRGRAGVAAASQAGGLFGEALGRAAGGTAPGEKEAIAQQQVQQLVAQQVEQQGLNLSDPNDYVKMTEIAANAFNKLGMTDMAAQAGQQGLAVRKQFQTEQAEKFAPILNDQGQVIAQRSLKTNKVIADPRAPKDPDTVINNNLGDQDELAKSLAKELGKDIVSRRKDATDAKYSLQSANNAVDLLNSGVITGTGSTYLVSAGKALKRIGFNAFEDDVKNTEAFVANQAKQVANIIKAFGAGTGLSDADREYAEKAAAGKISMDENSLRRIIKINQEASRNVIQDFNQDIQNLPPGAAPIDLTVQLPDMKSPVQIDNEEFATPKTQQDFDALEPGTIYIDPVDGKKYRKNV